MPDEAQRVAKADDGDDQGDDPGRHVQIEGQPYKYCQPDQDHQRHGDALDEHEDALAIGDGVALDNAPAIA